MKFYFVFFIFCYSYPVFVCSMQNNNIIECIRNNNLKEMVELIENGTNPNKEYGCIISNKPIVFAACQKNLEAIDLLLKNKADINGQNDNGFTALIVATRDKSIDIVQFLLAHNANTSLTNNHGSDAMFWADKEAKTLLHRQDLINSFIKKTKKSVKNGKKSSNVYDLVAQRQIYY